MVGIPRHIWIHPIQRLDKDSGSHISIFQEVSRYSVNTYRHPLFYIIYTYTYTYTYIHIHIYIYLRIFEDMAAHGMLMQNDPKTHILVPGPTGRVRLLPGVSQVFGLVQLPAFVTPGASFKFTAHYKHSNLRVVHKDIVPCKKMSLIRIIHLDKCL